MVHILGEIVVGSEGVEWVEVLEGVSLGVDNWEFFGSSGFISVFLLRVIHFEGHVVVRTFNFKVVDGLDGDVVGGGLVSVVGGFDAAFNEGDGVSYHGRLLFCNAIDLFTKEVAKGLFYSLKGFSFVVGLGLFLSEGDFEVLVEVFEHVVRVDFCVEISILDCLNGVSDRVGLGYVLEAFEV